MQQSESPVQKLMRLILRAELEKSEKQHQSAASWYRLATAQAHTVATECAQEIEFCLREAIDEAKKGAERE